MKKNKPTSQQKKTPIKSSSQAHIISSGIKAKKVSGTCGGCGKKKRLY